MHWTVLLVFAWIYLVLWDVLATFIAAIAFFVLLVVHEIGHVAILRWKKVPISGITFYGIHGTTEHAPARQGVEIAVAWAGVGAQVILLVAATLIAPFALSASPPWLAMILGPVFLVFTRFNIFLMIVALLPIGPFDGRQAWAVFPYWRAAWRRRKQEARAKHMAQFEESSAKAAQDLLDKLSRKNQSTKEGDR